jgi:hypothetical protein
MKAVFHVLPLTVICTLQNAPVEEKANLQTQTAPLMQVAQAHLDGKEAYARGIATELLEDFLQVEERFTKSGMTEQETIDAMRAVGGSISASRSGKCLSVLKGIHSSNIGAVMTMKHSGKEPCNQEFY